MERAHMSGRAVWSSLLLFLAASFLAACQDEATVTTRIVEVQVTRLVTTTPQVERAEAAAPTRNAIEAVTFASDEPDTYTEAVENGPLALDPALVADRASLTPIRNVMETLIYPHPRRPGRYIPLLATSWRFSEQGRTVTFSIRRNVHFSNGSLLTPSDVAYSLQRLLLVGPPDSPQHVLLQPLLGTRSRDVTAGIDGGPFGGDRSALLANAPRDQLAVPCEQVQQAIVPNDRERTLTIHLSQPWRPLLAALSRPWASAIDRQWAVEQGAWDGRCETWHDSYALDSGESPLSTVILGTGPFVLDHWAPGAEYVLVANANYWRSEQNPAWDEGPRGQSSLGLVRVQEVPEPRLRWHLLRDGAVDATSLSTAGYVLADQQVGAICSWVSGECTATGEPTAPLRQYRDLPVWTQQALFFNFSIPAGEGGFTGSGRLDGDGVPPDFFGDPHVRRAFATCFDEEAFIRAGLNGEGQPADSLIPSFLLPAPAEPGRLAFDLQQCAEELSRAWDGRLQSNGFHLQLPFEAGNQVQQAVAILLQNGLRAVDERYSVEPVGLPRPLYLDALEERRLPLAVLTWSPELPDPHHWLAPAYEGPIAAYQALPLDLQVQANVLLEQGRTAVDSSERLDVYGALSQFRHDAVPFVLLPRPTQRLYQQRWVRDWIFNPASPLPYYYAYALNSSQ